MRIWLITVGEPLPLQGNRDRLWRTGLLAETLVGRGHEVLWWTSTMDHLRKRFFVEGEPSCRLSPNFAIRFLRGRHYRRNISLDRLVNHMQLARRFRALARTEPRPDAILCSFPTIELSCEAVRYAAENGTTAILDIRDLWPDIFLDVLPPFARPAGRLLLSRLFRQTRWALSACDIIFGISEGYLAWGLAKAGRERRASDAVFPLGYRPSVWTDADARAIEERLASSGVDPKEPLATFVGTFGHTYDLGTVIEAARLLNRRGKLPAHFVFCGSGQREEDWRRAATSVSGITFTGWLPAGQLAYLLHRSALGLAAYAEGAPQGIPNKVIEYLSAGLPVACSLTGESRTLLESRGCGQYYAPGDAQGLAEVIEKIVTNHPLQQRMRNAARDTFNRNFSAEVVYNAMANQLEQCARSGR